MDSLSERLVRIDRSRLTKINVSERLLNVSERLARMEERINFICEGVESSKNQWKKYNELNIPAAIDKISLIIKDQDKIITDQNKINVRLLGIEQKIKWVYTVGLVSIIILSNFFSIGIDTTKNASLSVIKSIIGL
jgi:hypothetical protein